MFLGLELDNIRKAQCVSQSSLAELSVVSVATVQRILSGKNSSVTTIVRVADALGYSITLQKRIHHENAP